MYNMFIHSLLDHVDWYYNIQYVYTHLVRGEGLSKGYSNPQFPVSLSIQLVSPNETRPVLLCGSQQDHVCRYPLVLEQHSNTQWNTYHSIHFNIL